MKQIIHNGNKQDIELVACAKLRNRSDTNYSNDCDEIQITDLINCSI